MRDTIMRGVTGGLIAAIPAYIIDQIEHARGLTDMTYPQFSSTLVMSKKQSKGIHGKIMGNTIHALGIAMSGVTTSYILKKTGRDHALIKGLGVGLVQGLLLAGTLPKLGLLEKPKMARTHTLSLINHIIFGLSCGYLISRMQGNETTVRDNKVSKPSAKLKLVKKHRMN
ncbi:MAG TPA: hypothetical protein VNT57_01440 [Desulfobacteria bacterium]|nr:hypothetical protein [Desulfobacteria bacterium]